MDFPHHRIHKYRSKVGQQKCPELPKNEKEKIVSKEKKEKGDKDRGCVGVGAGAGREGLLVDPIQKKWVQTRRLSRRSDPMVFPDNLPLSLTPNRFSLSLPLSSFFVFQSLTISLLFCR